MSNKSKDYWLVTIQFLLFLLYFWNPLPYKFYSNNYIQFIAILLTALGLVILLLSIYALRKSLSVFPSPKSKATLINKGIYLYMRHPIYSSILITSFSWAIFSNSLFRIVIFAALFLLFEVKSNYEESLLINKFPNYTNYKKTTGKYFPKIN